MPKKKPDPKGPWILSKENTAEVKLFVEAVMLDTRWFAVVKTLVEMEWPIDSNFQRRIETALKAGEAGKVLFLVLLAKASE